MCGYDVVGKWLRDKHVGRTSAASMACGGLYVVGGGRVYNRLEEGHGVKRRWL